MSLLGTIETNCTAPVPDWAAIVRGIQQGDQAAADRLQEGLAGLRYFVRRHVGAEHADDVYQEVMLDLLTQIRRGDLREPARLAGYAHVIAKRRAIEHLRRTVFARNRQVEINPRLALSDRCAGPEGAVIREQQIEIASRILKSLPERDREVLVRFYSMGQDAGQITSEMGLTQTQFRLIKSRAKARFSQLCQACLTAKPRRDQTQQTAVA
jgi:RNA polymerase sigma factor (sigma-70 family)